jgi:hypothetical protein
MIRDALTRRTRGSLCGAFALLAIPSLAAAQDIYLLAGSSVYESDEACLVPDGAFSAFTIGGGGSIIGASASYINGDWPWPPKPPPGAGGSNSLVAASLVSGAVSAAIPDVYVDHGIAIQTVIDLFPVPLLQRLGGNRGDDGALGTFDQYVRPFIGVGAQFSTDGDPASVGDRLAPTVGVKGDTNLLLSFGAQAYFPSRQRPLRFVVQYRGNVLFVDQIEVENASGETFVIDTDRQTWGEWSVGLSLRVGG